MKLILQNGYPAPWPKDKPQDVLDAYGEEAAGVTLTLEGVIYFQWLHVLLVEFESREAAEKAKALTGWTWWDEWTDVPCTLEARTSPEDGYAHPAIVAAQAYDGVPNTAYCGFLLLKD